MGSKVSKHIAIKSHYHWPLLKNDFNVRETLGVNFNPIKNSWSISRSTPANFMVLGQKN